jgi:putative hemolysin
MKPILLSIIVLLLTACNINQELPETPTVPAIAFPTDTPQANMHNPASVYCQEQGYTSEIRTAMDGSQSGACIFPDGSECDEWAYFRSECGPGQYYPGSTPATPTTLPPTAAPTSFCTGPVAEGWRLYCHETLGLSFEYPENATIDLTEDGYSIFVNGPLVNDETWPVLAISFPRDRQEYRLPEGADLQQWLSDHYLLGEPLQAEVSIAGTTALHTRFDGSPQAYADDRYYFAHDGQIYVVLIMHTGYHEDWELYNHFLDSIRFVEIPIDQSAPTPIPTALPLDPAIYQGWTTYTNYTYGFTLRFPSDIWIVEESTTDIHLLTIRPLDQPERESIRLTFRRIGEEALLWPTGVGEGEFIPQGTLDIAGNPINRLLLVCPAGEVTSIWYHQAADQPNIARGDLEFGIIFSATPYHCQDGFSLGGELQLVGESIIASLTVP